MGVEQLFNNINNVPVCLPICGISICLILYYCVLQLKREGFEKIDILDSSDKMLELARQRRVYQNVITAEIKGYNSTPLEGGNEHPLLQGYTLL